MPPLPSSAPDAASGSRPASALWLWLSLLPLGFGTWVPIVAGRRAGNPAWVRFGAVVLVVWVAGFALAVGSADDSPARGFAGLIIIVAWLLAIAFTFSCRRAYRQRASAHDVIDAQDVALDLRREQRQRAQELAERDPEAAILRGVGRPDLPGAVHGDVVDVNHVPRAILRTLPGVDAETADRIVATREGVGLFSSVDDLGFVLDLPADVVVRLRPLAVALP